MKIYICILVFIGIMCIVNRILKVKKYQVVSNTLPGNFDGAKIVMLTDLHNNSFGKDNIRLIKKIKEQNPDYIMIAGDLIVGRKKFLKESTLYLLKELSEHYEIFYAPGNHEQKVSLFPETKDSTYITYLETLEKMGIHYLNNKSMEIKIGEEVITITGLSVDRKYYGKEWAKVTMEDNYLRGVIGYPKKDQFQILLAHQPKYFKAYAAWGGDLILSGHNHGGIMILPKLGGVISPSYQFFPKYDYGVFEEGKATMIISKGLGLHTIKIRIGHFPEISVIELKKS